MIYNDWAATNTGIFYQLNRVKLLPFVDDTVTVENLDQKFLLENSSKEMFSSDTNTLVSSILASYYHQWQDLTAFYKTITPGITSEIVSSNDSTYQNQNKVALNDSNDLFTTGGNDYNSNNQTSTKTKNNSEFRKFLLSNNFYDTINMQVRNYLFINVY